MSYDPIKLKGQQYYETLGWPEINTLPVCLSQACDNFRAKRRPCQTCRSGCSYHSSKHTPYQGNKGQYTMRKDMASIHTRTHTHTHTQKANILHSYNLHKVSPTWKQPFKTTALGQNRRFATSWSITHQTPLSMGFSRQILGWVAFSYSRGSFWPRDRSSVSWIGRQILYHWAIPAFP